MQRAVELTDVNRTVSGERIERYRLHRAPVMVEIVTAGAAITRIEVPDRSGRLENVVLAYADLHDYLDPHRTEYFGAVVGRVANRIAQGRFELDECTYRLETNDGPNHLHGGRRGFDRRLWRATVPEDEQCLQLDLVSADGDEGYPGEVSVRATYTLQADATLRLECTATASAPTLLNLTNHSYFNLAGEGDVLAHELRIDADRYCGVDDRLIPTGELRDVAGTPFDFRLPRPIGRGLDRDDPQLSLAGGYDHCYVLNGDGASARDLPEICVLTDPRSGRRLHVATNQPGLQFYSGNFLDGTAVGPGGVRYRRHAGLCLETQRWPDAPHHPAFPSIVLRPGERYHAVTTWRFDVLP